MLSRRLTALLASFLLLPSLVLGGGQGCIMGALGAVRAEGPRVSVHAAHRHGQHANSAAHGAHRADAAAFVDESATSPPIGLPHAPAQCILVAGCGAAVAPAAVIAIDAQARVVRRVDAVVALAPDSPALGLEPPPPRV
jgi:hypothetical protein